MGRWREVRGGAWIVPLVQQDGCVMGALSGGRKSLRVEVIGERV